MGDASLCQFHRRGWCPRVIDKRSGQVLLTGAAGFIGSRIARRLVQSGCSITALVRPGSARRRLPSSPLLQVLEGDLERLDEIGAALETSAPSIIIHTAWHAQPGMYLTDPGNLTDVRVSMDLFQRAQAWGCERIVGIGSYVEYDTDCGWLDETVPLVPRSMYASAKAALYLLGAAWARESRLSFAWIRLFSQYGPGEDKRRLVPSVITSLLAGQKVSTTPGEQIRDYLHVDDVASAVSAIALSSLEGAVNVGSGSPIRIRDLVRCIERQIGAEDLVEIGARPASADEPPFIVANTTRIRRELDWRPTIDLETGIADTVAWWRQQWMAS